MLNFHPLTEQDLDKLRPYFVDNPSRLCDLTVGVIFIWRDYYKTEYAIYEDVLYFKVDYPGTGTMFTLPHGGDIHQAYEQIRAYCQKRDIPIIFYPIPRRELDTLMGHFPCARVMCDRDTFDYLYEKEALQFFKGKKLAGQRNHVNRFLRTYENWHFAPMTEGDLPAAMAFLDRYAAAVQKESGSFAEDLEKTRQVLQNVARYGMVAGALWVGGDMVGLSVGEVLGDTLFIHTEKADRSVEGGYQMLVSQFAQQFAGESVTYINREDDTGDPGLRTSKLAYKPVELLEKYAVAVEEGPCPGREGHWQAVATEILNHPCPCAEKS